MVKGSSDCDMIFFEDFWAMGLRNVLKIVVGWLLLDKTDGWCSLGRILRVSALINSNESSASSWSATRTQQEHGALANALGVMLVVATAAPNVVVAAPIPMELTAGDQSVDYALNVNRRTSRRLAGQVEKKKSNEKAMEVRDEALRSETTSIKTILNLLVASLVARRRLGSWA